MAITGPPQHGQNDPAPCFLTSLSRTSNICMAPILISIRLHLPPKPLRVYLYMSRRSVVAAKFQSVPFQDLALARQLPGSSGNQRIDRPGRWRAGATPFQTWTRRKEAAS
ncbi:hypothetical protein OIU78_005950 [Salix suchowensis]|nr:hypothetical protein OIU78_005950 [Salix suchowensis]